MPITTAHYTPGVVTDLTDRTVYEAWLLEAAYDLASRPIAVSDNDTWLYPANGGPPSAHYYATCHTIIGNWKPKFLEAGAPLVFVTSYKILDMVIEWVLHQNLADVPWQFAQKITALGGQLVFPELIEIRAWLRERVIALYRELAPLRNTVIHRRNFQSTNGTLEIQPDKGTFANQTVILNESNVRTFAVLMVSLVRYLEGAWAMDYFQEKRLRRALDDLSYLHGLPSLGQREPLFQSVRVFVADEDPIVVDIQRVRDELTANYPANDVEFCIRIIAVTRDGQNATAYLLHRDQLHAVGTQLQTTLGALSTSVVPLPNDIDPMASAIAMGLTGPGSTAQPGHNP